MTAHGPARCAWCLGDPLSIAYHDAEWGVPVRDDSRLFEMITLEGAQAGLSWITILRKRQGYRAAFANFDPHKVARFDERDVARLVADASIVRHRGKIESTIKNAQGVVDVQKELGSFSSLVWRFVGDAPVRNRRASSRDVPASTPESDAMSKELKRRGFSFVGSTICYAFMQACGLVNDHTADCYRHGQVA